MSAIKDGDGYTSTFHDVIRKRDESTKPERENDNGPEKGAGLMVGGYWSTFHGKSEDRSWCCCSCVPVD